MGENPRLDEIKSALKSVYGDKAFDFEEHLLAELIDSKSFENVTVRGAINNEISDANENQISLEMEELIRQFGNDPS